MKTSIKIDNGRALFYYLNNKTDFYVDFASFSYVGRRNTGDLFVPPFEAACLCADWRKNGHDGVDVQGRKRKTGTDDQRY